MLSKSVGVRRSWLARAALLCRCSAQNGVEGGGYRDARAVVKQCCEIRRKSGRQRAVEGESCGGFGCVLREIALSVGNN